MQTTYSRTNAITEYDVDSLEGIQSIPVVKSEEIIKSDGEIISSLHYRLQRKATEHKKNGDMDLAIACLRKSNEIMALYDFRTFTKGDFLRVVKFLKASGQFDKAREEQQYLHDKLPKVFNPKERQMALFNEALSNARMLDTDLLEMSSHDCTCGECSKYQGRVYSISGKDRRFPALPQIFFNIGAVHEDCRHILYPYQIAWHDTNEVSNMIRFSNRPFVDSRGQAEKMEYQDRLDEELTAEKDKLNYDYLSEHLPNIAPKSFAGYRRMKESNSKSYLKLKEAAAEIGMEI